ncbi:LysE family translocator [Albidovulum sp.]
MPALPAAESVLAFALASALIELTPGPNMAWLAILTLAEGRRSGLAAVLGVALGLAGIGLAAALGLAALVAASELAWQALRWAGVLFLLWLAWDGWRGAEDGVPELRTRGRLRAFRRGLITNLLNPKAAAFFVAVLPGFVGPADAVLASTLLLSALYVAIATAIHGAIVLAADGARRLFSDRRRTSVIRRGLSLLLAGVALWFAWATGRG